MAGYVLASHRVNLEYYTVLFFLLSLTLTKTCYKDDGLNQSNPEERSPNLVCKYLQ